MAMIRPEHCVAPLFVPGDRPDRIDKAFASGAQAIILDLEDAVAPEQKNSARGALLARSMSGRPILVRVNGMRSPWHGADIAAVRESAVAGIILPKAQSVVDTVLVRRSLPHTMALVLLVETTAGICRARRIAAVPGVSRLAFGSVDFSVDLRCGHDPVALATARAELVLASRLAGLPSPLDGVCLDIRHAEVAGDEAVHARRLGFGGKMCIHPDQLESVQAAFEPTAEEVSWAQRVLELPGSGVDRLDGAMIDAPVRARAQAILATPRKSGHGARARLSSGPVQ